MLLLLMEICCGGSGEEATSVVRLIGPSLRVLFTLDCHVKWQLTLRF